MNKFINKVKIRVLNKRSYRCFPLSPLSYVDY